MNETAASGGAAGGGMFFIFMIALVVFMIASLWKIFTKAGKPGWWLILMFIPIVNLVIGILALAGLAANFGKSGGFVVGLILLPIVFFPILAFGDAEYRPLPTAAAL